MRQPLIHSKLQGLISGSWSSTCTIQRITYTTSGANQRVPNGAVDIGGMVDIPCRMAPKVVGDVTDNEIRDSTTESILERRILKLNGFFPQIQSRAMRAVVDGQAWNIRGVESDSQAYSTRLQLEIIKA